MRASIGQGRVRLEVECFVSVLPRLEFFRRLDGSMTSQVIPRVSVDLPFAVAPHRQFRLQPEL